MLLVYQGPMTVKELIAKLQALGPGAEGLPVRMYSTAGGYELDIRSAEVLEKPVTPTRKKAERWVDLRF